MQTLLPMIAVAVLLAVLSGQYLRSARRDATGAGYVLSYPKVMTVIASVWILMVAVFVAVAIYALTLAEFRFALVFAVITLAFGVLAYFALRQALTKITVNDSGVKLQAWGRHVYAPWSEVTVDAITRPKCVVIRNSSAQEIRVYESMIGAGIIEDFVRRNVDPLKVRFVRNLEGEHQLFYREPSNKRLERP